VKPRSHSFEHGGTFRKALTPDGLTAFMTIEGGTSSDAFLPWLEHFLLPELPPNDTVVVDSLGAHRSSASLRS
jgi:transposase